MLPGEESRLYSMSAISNWSSHHQGSSVSLAEMVDRVHLSKVVSKSLNEAIAGESAQESFLGKGIEYLC